MALRIGTSIGVCSQTGGGAYSAFSAGVNGVGAAPLFAHGDGGIGDSTFLDGTDGPPVFPRQPVVVRAANGDLLAFAQVHEGSIAATGDKSISAIQMRRSTNNGVTWGSPQIVYHETSYASTVVWINFGVVVVNRVSGKIHLWFTHNEGSADVASEIKMYYQTSSDHGATWTAATDKSSTVKKASGLTAPFDDTDGAWGWCIAGPGPGIQLLNGSYGSNTLGANGRLIIPCDHRYSADTSLTCWSHVMYSDDDGANWALSGLTESTAANDFSSEFCVAEYGTSGHLYGQMRIIGTNFRGATKSTDGGITWSTMVINNGSATSIDGSTTTTNLASTSTQGCVVGVPGTNTLYCSFLNDTGMRANLTIARSDDGGVTWPSKRVLDRRPSAYSSLLVIDPQSLFVAWESITNVLGHRTTNDYQPCQYIRCVRLPVGWVTDLVGYPEYYHWDFNEASTGAVSTDQYSQQIRDRGPYRSSNGIGQSGGSFSSSGLVTSGSAYAVTLCEENNNNSADASLGNALDIGSGDFTGEIIFTMAASTGTRVIWDNRNNSGAGWTLSVTALDKPAFAYSDGTNSCTATSSVSVDTGNVMGVRFFRDTTNHRAAISVIDYTAGTAAVTTNATTDSPGNSGTIIGTRDNVIGSQSDGSTNPCAITVYAARITRGVLKTSGWITPNDTKQTLAGYWGYTVPSPSLPSTAGTAKLWVAATYDGGYAAGLDHYGAWDKGALPRVVGTGYQSYRDIASSKLFRAQSQNQGFYWNSDSTVGSHHRLSYTSATANGAYRISSASLGTLIDDIQNYATFTVCGCVKLIADTGNIQGLFGNNNNGTSQCGLYVFYNRINATTGGLVARIVGKNAVPANTNVINTFGDSATGITLTIGTWYFWAMTGAGFGNKLNWYLKAFPGSLASATLDNAVLSSANLTDPAGTPPFASTTEFAIGGRSDQSAQAGNMSVKNVLAWTSALSKAELQEWMDFAVAY